MSSELVEPCPWCGERTVIHDGTGSDVDAVDALILRLRPKCTECGAEGPVPQKREHGLDAWNRRYRS